MAITIIINKNEGQKCNKEKKKMPRTMEEFIFSLTLPIHKSEIKHTHNMHLLSPIHCLQTEINISEKFK